MKTRKTSVILLLVIVFLFSLHSISIAAALGTAFTYQGHLYDNNDVANNLYDFHFRLFDAVSDGAQVGGDLFHPDVNVIDGYFTVVLDFEIAFDENAVWLDIGVRPGILEDPNAYTPLAPRQAITPVPYAVYAKSAGPDNDWMVSGNDIYAINSGNVGIGTTVPSTKLDVVGTVNATAFTGDGSGLTNLPVTADSDWTISGSDMYTDAAITGNVGIGTSTPLYRLHSVDTTPSSDGPAIYGEHAVTDFYGIGVQGVGLYKGVAGNVSATGTSTYYGVAGSADTSSSEGFIYGVHGSGSGGGTSYGVFGVNYSDSYGTYGISYGSGNYGYLGDSSYGAYGKDVSSGNFGYLGDDSYGVYGKNNSSSKYGYIGSTAHGVFGESSSAGFGNFGYLGGEYGAYGRYRNGGHHGYLGGFSYGAYGEYNSSSYGYLGGSLYGVYGRNDYTNGYAVYGYNGGRNTYGYLGGTYGVYGASATTYAGYFSGNVYVSGYLSAADIYDRTPYPKDLATAYQAVMSMERLGDGQYMENDTEMQLDHSTLSDFISSEDGHRNLSATVSCLNEVVKDLVRKVEDQHRLIKIQNTQIQQMTKQLQTNKQLQTVITKGAVQ